jgi:alanyl-tRNA synthetase
MRRISQRIIFGVYTMDAQELREAYVNFFKERGHAYIRSASLIPENDPTVLFTTAGMHPLVPYLLGEKHPEGTRLVDFQKCVRTGDIDEVGDASHLTFFEMLGNWSLGDYFKKESIQYSFDLLQTVLKIPVDHLAVTAFAGEDGIPKDTETAELWKSHGLKDDQIFFYGRKDNWWGPAGQTGPCGPDTEIFFDDGRPKCCDACGPSCHCGKYTEIWNNVFMQYFKDADGKFSPLKQKNVDTGMGLERVLRIINGKETVYDTELFQPIIRKVEEISGKKYADDMRSFRIIADHLRAATFLLGDGVVPAKMGQGYILRRLVRRASRYMSKLGFDGVYMQQIAEIIVRDYSAAYPELKQNEKEIYEKLTAEEEKFHKTLAKGLRRFDEMLAENGDSKVLNGELVFKLYDTFGFPVELTQELAQEKGLTVDINDFNNRFKEHQEKSRAGSDQIFKGGLADHTVETTKLHTATHLLNAALRNLIDPDIRQKGSNITAERLRFDFNFDRKLTPEELKAIEKYVNDAIKADIPVVCKEMSLEDAKKSGAIGVFDSKYGQTVKAYIIGDISAELCGGPHVTHTGELQGFKIKKEESSAAGVRRIKAVVGKFD